MLIKRALSVFIIILAVATVASIFIAKRKSAKTPIASLPSAITGIEEPQTLGAQVFDKASNPLKDELPDVNPLNVETNPFQDVYKNPFK